MYTGKLAFAQLIDFLPLHTFRRCVARFPSNYPTKTFSHLDQFLCMTFAQLTFRESLRDIEICLRSHGSKLYHLGIRGHVARSNLRMPTSGATGRFTAILQTRSSSKRGVFMPTMRLASILTTPCTRLIRRRLICRSKFFRGYIFKKQKPP